MEHWTVRKKRFEQCQQYALFERSAQAAVEWIRETQERCGAAAAMAAGGVARESRERVRLLAQLADGLVEKGHPHAVQIKEWVAAVDARSVHELLLETSIRAKFLYSTQGTYF